ncbi:MAG: DUF1631 family protein [Gammaproteobacteria bacterium]
MASPPDPHVSSLGKQARELFVVHVGRVLSDLGAACEASLREQMDAPCSNKERQERTDAWQAFQKAQAPWIMASKKSLQRKLLPAPAPSGSAAPSGRLELMAEGAMDDQILASRLALRVLDLASTELNELRLRIQHLEHRQELPKGDVLLPDVIAKILIDHWIDAQMSREAWQLVQDALAPSLARHMLEAYQAANGFLVSSGVMKEIDLQALVRRAPGARSDVPAMSRVPGARQPGHAAQSNNPGAAAPVPGRASSAGLSASGSTVSGRQASTGGSLSGVHEETRMMTSATPLARARMRAQGVVGKLRRFIRDRVGEDFAATEVMAVSPRLQQAIAGVSPVSGADAGLPVTGQAGADAVAVAHVNVERAAAALRDRSNELKQAAETPSEKATIEVVALMFQSILTEERIPASVRVWFARLQIPVLRVALAEPEFFSALQHPARRLIDRMGSCVMGFETNVGSAALEAEIKRVVQVIEQYPETGRRVFQLVYDEFEKFLSTYLTENTNASRFVPIAQQIEQKETLSVQFTIELRKLLDDVPVRDEIRDFLFKVWVEVLAVASIKFGLRHSETASLKQVASDLLWAASAKPNRNDRARVIQQLPGLLQRLRQGMSLLGFPPGLQDSHIKSVSDTLADAFMSRTDPIPQENLDRLSERLANLEDYLPESGIGDLDLDNESIELITGVDASNIEVISAGGSQPSEAMRAWAVELQIGNWFTLDHNGKLASVQLAWRSQRGQLFMFVTNGGRCYLLQVNRVASYLQAGLLLPSEEEALTVRATREALTKLDANPERLLT